MDGADYRKLAADLLLRDQVERQERTILIREAEKEFYKLLDGEVSHHYANKLVKVAFRKAFKELLK